MRIPRPSSSTLLILILPIFAQGSDINCEHVRVKGKSFDLSPLAGPHSLSHIEHQPPSIANTTYTIDICAPLKMPKKTPKGDKCPNSTRVCAIKHVSNKADHTDVIEKVIPVAGNFDHGRPIDAHVTRLKTEQSEDGTKDNREGLRLELHGGQYPTGKNGRKQMAVIELICPKGEEKDDDEAKQRARARESEQEDEDDEDGDQADEDVSDTAGLKFISYGPGVKNDKDFDILKLEWLTKHACEGRTDLDGADPSKSHWGFFTWFIIIAFLATATYLIFGSWLNYNKYGARGWDLLPHGDTIRDIPYLLRDWTRSVVSTVQGGGSRGGYSAV